MSSKLCIVFLTYNRFEYAEKALRAVLDNISWSGELHLHIADDGSPSGYVDRLRNIAGGYANLHSIGSSNSERRGYGVNWNLATQFIHQWADYVLPLEDDFVLERRLDLDDLIRVFEDPTIGCVRLGYLGWTQALRGEVVRAGGHVLLRLLPESAEPHLFAGHPRLETVEWERTQGPWPEGLTPQATEVSMAHVSREGIVWPFDYYPDRGPFAHIGTCRAQ